MIFFGDTGKTRKQFMDSYAQKDYLRAVIWGEKLLSEQRNSAKNETAEYFDDLFNVARAYEALKRYDKAISLYTQSLNGINVYYGEDIHYIHVVNNLAVAHCRKGEYDKAQQLLKKACDICEDIQGKDSPVYIDIMYNIANTYADLEDYDRALRLHFDVLAMRKKSDIDQVHSLNSICYIYEAQKDWTNAILYGEKAVSSIKRLGAQSAEESCKVTYYLAGLYENAQHYKTAIKLLQRVARWMENHLNQWNPYYIGCINRIADLYCKTEELEKALVLRQKTLQLIKETAGESHIYYANLLKNAALLCKSLDQRNNAETMLLRSIEIKQEILGKDGFDYIDDLIMLIRFYVEWGMIEKASDTLIFTLDNIGQNQLELSGFIHELTKVFLSMSCAGSDELHDYDMSDFVQRATELHDDDSIKEIFGRLQGKDMEQDE